MNQQTTVEQMHQLKVHGMAKLYQSISDQPVHQQPEPQHCRGKKPKCQV